MVGQWKLIIIFTTLFYPLTTIFQEERFAFKLWTWKSTRLFVVVREEVQSNKGPWAAS
jgi:hypothetical protein